ncbi:MAG TPA: hypothetical protein VK590_08755 [Saprospiraceae bacterium]|nr:hypothetical protein [Saprospiraceae bacterium]
MKKYIYLIIAVIIVILLPGCSKEIRDKSISSDILIKQNIKLWEAEQKAQMITELNSKLNQKLINKGDLALRDGDTIPCCNCTIYVLDVSISGPITVDPFNYAWALVSPSICAPPCAWFAVWYDNSNCTNIDAIPCSKKLDFGTVTGYFQNFNCCIPLNSQIRINGWGYQLDEYCNVLENNTYTITYVINCTRENPVGHCTRQTYWAPIKTITLSGSYLNRSVFYSQLGGECGCEVVSY